MSRGPIYTKRQHERARSLYVCAFQRMEDVALLTGVSQRQLERWASREGWGAARDAQMAAHKQSPPERLQALCGTVEEIALSAVTKARASGKSQDWTCAMVACRSAIYALVCADRSFRQHYNLIEPDEALLRLRLMKRFVALVQKRIPETARALVPVIREFMEQEKSVSVRLEQRLDADEVVV